MIEEPGILRQARGLVAAYRADERDEWVLDELDTARTRLRSLAAHPATSDALRDRTLGVLLVVDVIVSARRQRIAV